MSFTLVPAQGTATVVLTANQKIAVKTQGEAQVFQTLGFPNYPPADDLLQVVVNTTWVSSAFSAGGTVVIEAGAFPVLFATGTAPVISDNGDWQPQGAPVDIADGASMAFAAGDLLGGLVTATPTVGRNIQLPTAALLSAASNIAVGESFDFSLITLAAFALTITVNTGVTIVGAPATAGTAGAAARFRVRKDSATSYIVYRIA